MAAALEDPKGVDSQTEPFSTIRLYFGMYYSSAIYVLLKRHLIQSWLRLPTALAERIQVYHRLKWIS